MMLTLIERQFTVPVSVEAAWEHFVMVEHWPSWAKHIKRLELTSGGPLNAQSQGIITLKNGIKSTFVMTEFNLHHNWQWAGPFLWMTVYYDHRFKVISDERCQMAFHVAAEGFLVGFLGRVFARVYNRNLDVAIPNLIQELQQT